MYIKIYGGKFNHLLKHVIQTSKSERTCVDTIKLFVFKCVSFPIEVEFEFTT